MNSKERMMTAIHREKPDRLPATVHQWQGYHLDKYLNGISDLSAFQKFGLDAAVQYFEDQGQFWLVNADYTKFSTDYWKDSAEIIDNNPESRVVHHTIRTPEGNLTYKTGGDRKTTWITEYLVKRDEDIGLIEKYMPVPKPNIQPLSQLYDEVGDRGIVRGSVWGDQPSCWQHAACLIDVTTLILKAIDQPQWVHEFLTILLKKKLQFIESMKGAKFDLIETGGGSASSTVISPDLHNKFCLPYDKAMHEALHNLGFKITYHICGGTLGIEEFILSNGCDASETLAAPSIGGNQEPWEYKEKIGNQLALIGGMDQYNVLTRGTPDIIRDRVRTLFERVGYEGGYILSCTDHFFDTQPENIEIYADSARECVY